MLDSMNMSKTDSKDKTLLKKSICTEIKEVEESKSVFQSEISENAVNL